MKSRRSTRQLAFETLSDRCLLAANVFQNDVDPYDVNQDGACTVSDLRIVFGDVLANGQRELTESNAGDHLLDVSGDGRVSIRDVRELVEAMSAQATSALTDVVADEPLVTRTLTIQFDRPEGEGGLSSDVDFQSLIDLIEATVPEDQWEILKQENKQVGDTSVSLVITAAQDVQADINDLLLSLKNIQSTSIVIETRFITLEDNFFERIGVDFDFSIDEVIDNANLGDPIQRFEFSNDADIPFVQGSFGDSQPPFGEIAPGQGANFGMAILSDIETFFFVRAAQGDTANITSNVVTTVTNGGTTIIQTANGNLGANRGYIQSIQQLFKPKFELPENTVWGGELKLKETTSIYNGIGRTTQSLMLMVTPRIIIQEEEEG